MTNELRIQKKLVIIIIISVCVFLILGGALLFSPKIKNVFSLLQRDKKPSTSKEPSLPIFPDDPNVLDTTVFYTLAGKVKAITKNSITLVSKTNTIPLFTIDNNTAFFKSEAVGKSEPISKDEVKSGSNVLLTASYNFQRHAWLLSRITLTPTVVLPNSNTSK